jgi:hypothetical protein
MNKSVLLSIIFFLTTFITLNSRTIFVAKNGSNLNNGSINLPYATIQYAINKSIENDTIVIRQGEYLESVNIFQKKNITLKSYQSEVVSLSPFINNVQLSWELHSENIYKSKINDTVFQVFLENLPQSPAAFPNLKEKLFDIENAININVSSSKNILINGASKFSPINYGYFIGICSNNIVSIGGKIISNSEDQILIEDSAFYWNTNFENSYLGNGKGYLVGNLKFLDSPGEWFNDGEFIYFYPFQKNDLNKISIRNKIHAIIIQNSNNINIEKINVFGGSIYINQSNNNVLNDLNIEYPVPFHHPWSGFERFSPYWNGKEVIYMGPESWTGKGVEVGGENNKLINCYIAHSWGDGATIYGSGNTIENCIIDDCDWIANDCSNLNISGNNHLVIKNSLKNSARSIVVHRRLKNSKIINNEISRGGKVCSDLGLLYCYDTDGENTEIAFNFINDNFSKYNGVGIYLDENNANHNIHHNIIKNSSVGINLNKPCKNTIVYNNSLYGNEYSMGAWGNSGDLSNVTTFNNLTNTNKKAKWNYDAFYGTEMDSNYVYFDNNIFQDPQNNNFQLRKYSYPIDRGIINNYTTSYNGTLPDLGAIEFGSEPWKYGSDLIIENEKYYAPKAPINLKIIKNTPDTTLIQWEYPFGLVDTFYIERRASTDSEFQLLARVTEEELTFNDGNQPPGEFRYRIRAINEYGISDPSNSIEIFNPSRPISLYFDAENSDEQLGNTNSGDVLINNDNKDWISFKEIDMSKLNFDACMVNMSVPCEYAWQEIQVRIDRKMGRMIGKFSPRSTGGWDKYDTFSFPIENIDGIHDVYFKFVGNYGIGSIDWFTFYNSNGEVSNTFVNDSLCPYPGLKNKKINVKLFPNPSKSELAISFDCQELSNMEIKIFDVNGQVYFTKTIEDINPGTFETYLSDDEGFKNLKVGMYFVETSVKSKKINDQQIIKYIKINE